MNKWVVAWMLAMTFLCPLRYACAAAAHPSFSSFRAVYGHDEVRISASLKFDLPKSVESALEKGIPITFKLKAKLYRKRWYWYDKLLSEATQSYKISYQPLMRRWKLTTIIETNTSEATSDTGVQQYFDSLSQMLSIIQNLNSWPMTENKNIDKGDAYLVDLKFSLDLTKLPRPFRVGADEERGWDLTLDGETPLEFEDAK